MNNEEFKKVVDGCVAGIEGVLARKSQEYSSKDDKLHNFDKAKELLRCKTKEYALLGMLNKHLVSVIDMILRYEKDGVLPEEKMLDEKIGDSINYLILLKACFVEDSSCVVCGVSQKDSTESDRLRIELERRRPAGPAWDPYRNNRKAAVVKAMRKKVQPILEYLEHRNDKYTIAQIENIFAIEQQKKDHVPDDDFYISIINFLKELNLPNDRTYLPKNAITIDEKRNEIVKELEESLWSAKEIR